MKEKQNKEQELRVLESKTIETIWLEELDEFKEEYRKFLNLQTKNEVEHSSNKLATKLKKSTKSKESTNSN